MLTLFRVYLKTVGKQVPMLILIVIFQLIAGQLSAVTLREQTPTMRIAVSNEGAGELAKRFEEALSEISAFEVLNVDASVVKESVFERSTAQGLIVIPEYFDEYILAGESDAILLYPAPGIATTLIMEEYIATEIAILRAEVLFGQQLDSIGALPENTAEARDETPILELEYYGPVAREKPFSVPPAYGVPALFLLAAFLHAAQLVPGADNARMRMRGSMALARGFWASMLTLWIAWGFAVAAYALGMRVLYHVSVSPAVIAALVTLCFYAAMLGGLLSWWGLRNRTAWFFVPWLLLNMTIGGGLWSTGVRSPLWIPLLPVAAVVPATDGDSTGVMILMGSLVICLCFWIVSYVWRDNGYGQKVCRR